MSLKISKRRLALAGAMTLIAGLGLLLAMALPGEPRFEGRTVSSWSADLQSVDAAVRTRAVAALQQMGPDAAPFLGKTVNRDEKLARQAGRKAAEYLPNSVSARIRSFFHSSSPRSKSIQAARALEMIGPEASSAVPDLEKSLQHADPIVVTAAALALARIGGPGISVLTNALFDRAPNVRSAALLAMNQLGDRGEKAVPALIQMLRKPANPEALSAVMALGRMHDVAVPALVDLLQTSQPAVAKLAAQALAGTGAWGTAAVPALVQQVHAEDSGVRLETAKALGQIEAFKQPSADALVELLGDPDEEVRLAALEGLSQSPRGIRAALPMLEKLLSDANEQIQANAAFNLGQVTKPEAPAVRKLTELSVSGGPIARVAALRALESIRASGSSAAQ